MPGASHIGDTLNFYLQVNDQQSGSLLCSTQISNIVSCSYDPNDKEVFPPGVGPDNLTLSSDELKYTIRFQNTGNDTALVVHIFDQLDAQLNLNTFRIISYSHPVTVDINSKGLMRCSFNHIMLPDSGRNFLGSEGYFKYSIHAKSSIPLPVVVYNQADIYFDYNLPVVTNQVFNTLVDHLPISVQSITNTKTVSLYPNPVVDKLYFSLDDLNAGNDITFSIIDIEGKFIQVYKDQKFPAEFNCKTLSDGVYFLKVDSGNGPSYFRFVKLTH